MPTKMQFYANDVVTTWLQQQTGGPTPVINAALQRVITGDLSAAGRHAEIMIALDVLCQTLQAVLLRMEAGDA